MSQRNDIPAKTMAQNSKYFAIFLSYSDAYPELSRKSRMELFAKIVNNFQPLIILPKSSILDVDWVGSEYTSDIINKCQKDFQFLPDLELSEVTLACKKSQRILKTNKYAI